MLEINNECTLTLDSGQILDSQEGEGQQKFWVFIS